MHKETLTDEDKEKLFAYFEKKIEQPDPKVLQQMCIFNIVYYMGCRGHKNLHSMQKDTFEVR